MRVLAWLLSFWLALSPAFADSAFVAPTATGQAATGQIPGTATNDSATAGNVGEYIFSGASATGASATVTMTIATPAVITWTGNTLSGYVALLFTNSGGALPTGIVSGTTYYTSCNGACGNTFSVSTSLANAIAGTLVATSGSQSGTHTGNRGISPSAGVTIDLLAVSLTAGDWEVTCGIYFLAGATSQVQAMQASINSSVATLNRVGSAIGTTVLGNTVIGNTDFFIQPAGPFRVSNSGTTTLYCNGTTAWATLQVVSYGGYLRARRVR